MLVPLLPPKPATPVQNWLQIGRETLVVLVRVWPDLFVSQKVFLISYRLIQRSETY